MSTPKGEPPFQPTINEFDSFLKFDNTSAIEFAQRQGGCQQAQRTSLRRFILCKVYNGGDVCEAQAGAAPPRVDS
jgi:hypothetical protein